jgi:hypothetical protein
MGFDECENHANYERSGCWEEVGDSKAQKKVAQAFQDFSYAARKS